MNQFLSQQSRWDFVGPVAGDASARVFSRISDGVQTAILMETTGSVGAGHSLDDFVYIREWLNNQGVVVPKIYERYDDALIVEDFGSLSLKQAALQDNAMFPGLYDQAAAILEQLQGKTCPLDIPSYFESHVHKGLSRFVEYYVPAVLQEPANDDMRASYQQVWRDIMASMPKMQSGFIHVDFHAENLMLLSDGRIGVIDFQGGMNGPQAYDLANLLYDARMDIPHDMRIHILLQRPEDEQLWVDVMATQFHCRVLGQFIKLALSGKSGYLDYMPRLSNYVTQSMKNPLLKPLKMWCLENNVFFDPERCFDLEKTKKFIAKDAF